MASHNVSPPAASIERSVIRLMAFVDLATRIDPADQCPDDGESSDGEDKMEALLHAMQGELRGLFAAVNEPGARLENEAA